MFSYYPTKRTSTSVPCGSTVSHEADALEPVVRFGAVAEVGPRFVQLPQLLKSLLRFAQLAERIQRDRAHAHRLSGHLRGGQAEPQRVIVQGDALGQPALEVHLPRF